MYMYTHLYKIEENRPRPLNIIEYENFIFHPMVNIKDTATTE